MRETEASGWFVRNSFEVPVRALRLAAVTLGIGLVMTTGVARAQESGDDDKSFQEKIVDRIMKSVRGTNMDNQGIDYRERSPLVVPPRIDLPPPVAASTEVNAANWPKDPDEARRKAAIARRKKENKDTVEAARALSPSEPDAAWTAPPGHADDMPPRSNNSASSPIFGSISGLFGGNKPEAAPFKGEPNRESLTQPPPGYQTPSPDFAYGTGPKESMNKESPKTESTPAAGKTGDK
jgi:hypothetical protein